MILFVQEDVGTEYNKPVTRSGDSNFALFDFLIINIYLSYESAKYCEILR